MNRSENRKRRNRRPGGGSDLVGITMALLLASRFVGPVTRGFGPAGRHVLVLLLLVTLPLGVGYRVWHQRREDQRLTEARVSRARARLGVAPDAREAPEAPAAAEDPPGADGMV